MHTPKNCDDNNPCTIDTCDLATGQCQHTAKNCDDNDPCTIDTCDATTGQCQHTPINCDDNNACTLDTCVNGVCQHQNEICNNMIDDNGNGLIDCADPCCSCPPIKSDPTRIRFAPSGVARDQVRSSGHVKLLSSVDPTSVRVAWLISTSHGVVYEGVLEPGNLTPVTGGRFLFQDPGALLGQGTRDGIYRAELIFFGRTAWYKLQAYGDMAAACGEEMSVQFYLGDRVYMVSGIWRPTAAGWTLHGHHGTGFGN